jgi:hypothetical protein
VQLGLENKKKAIWAAVLGALATLLVGYQIWSIFFSAAPAADTSAQAAAPIAPRVSVTTRGGKAAKRERTENLDPTLRLDLLTASEQTQYEGSGRNIFVSQPDPVEIPKAVAPANTDVPVEAYKPPAPPPPAPIPLKFFGFASKPGEPKKIFLSQGEDVWVAGEGEIVNRRYKVVRINPNSVEMQDVVNSGPPQNIPLTQGG